MKEDSIGADKNQTAVATVLGEPFMLEFTEPVRKMRTHLMVGSAAGLAVVFMGLKVHPSTTLLGLQLEGLTEGKMLIGLMLFNVYLLIHFLWSSADSFIEWRLRLTGTRVTYQTGAKMAHASADYPSDPRQSTLHRWWMESAKEMIHVPSTLRQIDTHVSQLMELVGAQLKPTQDPQWTTIQGLNQSILYQLGNISSTLKATTEILGDGRIPVSLKRFDRTFYFFQKSQTYRWILIEWATPTLMAALAIGFLLRRFMAL